MFVYYAKHFHKWDIPTRRQKGAALYAAARGTAGWSMSQTTLHNRLTPEYMAGGSHKAATRVQSIQTSSAAQYGMSYFKR